MDSQTQIPQDIRAFLESLLQDANILNLDDAAKEEMIKQLFVRLDNFMLTTIVESLPSDKLDEFTKMSESGKSKEELEAYLKANIPNAEEVFSRAMLSFRDLYLGNVALGKGAPTDTTN